MDVGSTTVKLVACLQSGAELLFQLYRRHESRQLATLLDALRELESALPINAANTRLFVTGSGGARIAEILGGKFVQEVTAVSLAVERLHPAVRSVIELGGQDSKIIAFQESTHPRPSQKVRLHERQVRRRHRGGDRQHRRQAEPAGRAARPIGYDGIELHPVAGKCGVFAETDITGCRSRAFLPEQLMASLFDAIVLQNLTC